MAQPSAYEQFLLELINRGRLDPLAEAVRYQNDLNEGLDPGTISSSAKQPLAWNGELADGARAHSAWMLDVDMFSHSGIGGSSPGNRMAAAGYEFTGSWAWGENIAWAGTTGSPDVARYVEIEHEGLFLSEGHRLNTMNGNFQEIGLGVTQGIFTSDGAGFNAVMTTENFARSGSKQFLTGVAFSDLNGDNFYSPGEGLAGVSFTARDLSGQVHSAMSMDAGGYQQTMASGDYTVTIGGVGLSNDLQVGITLGSENLKLDLVGDGAVACSGSLVMGINVRDGILLGTAESCAHGNTLDNLIEGNSGANLLKGNGGADDIRGNAGNDRIYGGAGEDLLSGGQGKDFLSGGEGADRLTGGEGGDYLFGGEGSDVFVYEATTDSCLAGGMDRIYDFVCGVDKIDVLDANLAAGLSSQSLAADRYADIYFAMEGVAANAMVEVDVTTGAKRGTYLFVNDGSSAISSSDMLVGLAGITGSLSLSDFI